MTPADLVANACPKIGSLGMALPAYSTLNEQESAALLAGVNAMEAALA